MLEKVKDWISEHRREVLIFVLFFLISSLSFALGYLSAKEFTHSQIIIEKNSNLLEASGDEL
ncbi:MAG: hypothetical protein COU09_00990 [Candidatus Harrisonbacteria bacterium CG10_big_fil_rev_8_21_14_0_10_44_23]|uniref:Polysaccharide chain length determinant N-terminal domain-containing protein n=1 Tax=Candidatus Harrisonbacteria bacterium CG10_big_fil_rev_8_21_14_0_10_44_23 TaxID=1974585 RepID=A0A2H0UQK3_9BACT|nr:MAG: hypothetical protein COU09_00990 [Candidatus Harrisonbacteria bacterium CG10_big_fil_rev_8_21_14_0_10_44_23]